MLRQIIRLNLAGLLSKMSKGRLKPDDYKFIQSNYCFLKENIDAKDLLDYLFQKDVISTDDKEKICGGRTKLERNELFFTTLLDAGPGEAFRFFVKSLEKNYKFVLEHLGIADSVEREAEELKFVKGALKQENRRLKSENGALKKENKSLKCKTAKEQTSTETLRKQVAVLKEKIAKEKYQKDLRQSSDELGTANRAIEIMINEIRLLNEEKAKAISETESQNKEISRLKREQAKGIEEMNILNEEIQRCKKEQDETLAILEFYKKILIQKNYENETVINDFLSLNEEKSRALNSVEESNREMKRITDELAKISEKYEADKVEMERLQAEANEIKPLKDELVKVQKCLEEKELEIKQLSEQIDNWKEKCFSQKRRIGALLTAGREEDIDYLPTNQLCKHCREKKINTMTFEGQLSTLDVKLIKWENFSLSGHLSKAYQ